MSVSDPFSGAENGSSCENSTATPFYVTEGEGLRIIPEELYETTYEAQYGPITWHRQLGNTSFSTEETERIHHHGPELFFLPVSVNDTDRYIAKTIISGECYIFQIDLHVMSAGSLGMSTLYTPMDSSEREPRITCPEQVSDLCKNYAGVISWYMNSRLLEGQKLAYLRLYNATKANSGLYTCSCTWTHNGVKYNSTAHKKLQMHDPLAFSKIQFIEPATNERFVQPGARLSINCRAFFGTNIRREVNVSWEKNNRSVSGMDGYSQTFSSDIEAHSGKSFFSSTLIIHKVKETDFKASFRCKACNTVDTLFRTLKLKPAESVTNLVVALAFVSIVFLSAAIAMKFFAVDLVLFSRRFWPCRKPHHDGSQYDVYVVYRSQKHTNAMEDVLSRFLSQALPLVLEKKCGYRVFIHGRDDIPGEDRLKQVEVRMRLSRSLMVVLTPGSLVSSPSSLAEVDVDWQIGLYQALVQEIRVILVQLGDLGPEGHARLTPTLQHLIRKCAPLCWREDSLGATHWNSRFWKRVRYAMPPAFPKPSSSHVV